MEYLKIITLIIAYSFGIATLIVQIICYIKDIEYKETILLTLAFLAVIISTTIRNIIMFENIYLINIQKLISSVLIVLLAIAIPINIHKEKKVKNLKIKNQILFIIGVLISLFFIIFYNKNSINSIYIISGLFLFISVIYSMFSILILKPASSYSQDKTEKLTAIIIITSMVGTLLFITVFSIQNFIEVADHYGAYILSIICIILTLTKLPNDIKRLSKFNLPQKIEVDQLIKFNISQREKEVLLLLIQGKAYKEIGNELFISLPTVKTHVSNIYEKLNVRNRLELSNLVKQL